MTDLQLFAEAISLLKKYENTERSETGEYNLLSVKTNGKEILVRDGKTAAFLADLFEAFERFDDDCANGFCVDYYDPVEDRQNGCVDSDTGWWTVYPMNNF